MGCRPPDYRLPARIRPAVSAHKLFLDGVYVDSPNGSAWIRWVKEPTSAELTELTHTIVRLAALVPKPRVNLPRFHGVFAPWRPTAASH